MTVMSAILNGGRLLAQNATLTQVGAVSGKGSAVIGAGGTLVFDAAFSQDVSFTGSTGELVLAQSQGYSATISGFSTSGGTSLGLRDIGFVSPNEATFSGGVLTVTDGTHAAHIKLAGDFSGSTFTASSDGHGGTLVVDPTERTLQAMVQAMAAFSAPVGHLAPTHDPLQTTQSTLPTLATHA
jgi:hypothetical protein